MKRIITLTLLAATALAGMAQDNTFKFKGSGRALFDQASYFDTKNVDLHNGVSIADLRIGIKAYYGKWYLRSEISYKQQKLGLKDFYLQYSFEKSNYLRLGHYTVPFGLQSATGSADKEFLSDPEANIFQPGRRIGLMHTYYTQPLWVQYGIFADNAALTKSTDKSGSQGYTAATRFVLRPLLTDHSALHFGISGAYRKAEATKDGLHAAIKYGKGWMTTVDKRKVIDVDVIDAKDEWKWTPEMTGYVKRFAFAAQYFGSHIRREDIQGADGKSRFNSSGYYVTLRGLLLNSGNYTYNAGAACIVPPTNKSLELVLGYGMTDFNDSEARALIGTGEGVFGGKFKSANVGLSLYWNKYITFRAEYDYMTSNTLEGDKTRVNAVQFRAQYKF